MTGHILGNVNLGIASKVESAVNNGVFEHIDRVLPPSIPEHATPGLSGHVRIQR